jgi:hypothetical protein
MEPENKPEIKKQSAPSLMKIAAFAGEFGFIIALPLLGLTFIGKYLDNKYHSKYFILIGLVLALFFSTLYLYKRLDRIIKELQNKQ